MEGDAAATIGVWWDMNDCPIPVGYDARRIRSSIERAFKKRGYSDPVSINAYGDQTQTTDHLLRGLSSTGVVVAHTKSKSTSSLMFSDMVEWRARNPPPATMMLISNQVEDVFSWDLARLQQETKYNLFLAFSSRKCHEREVLFTVAKWRWKDVLGSADNEHDEIICRETGELSAMFYCKSCNFDSKSSVRFKRHLSSKRHELEEIVKPTARELDPVTRIWGRNYPAKPEYATANIAVWWDMRDCPVPEGYDAGRVRPSIEGAFKHLGYSGPVSINAYGNLSQTPEHILRGLSSTGVNLAHTDYRMTIRTMQTDIYDWRRSNPPPATMMVIADQEDDDLAYLLELLQRRSIYNLFLAYSYRPYKMPVLVTSAEWLWESLVADVCLCSHHPETRRHVLRKCSGKGQSTLMFFCKPCFYDSKNFDDFMKHLSSKEHASLDARINRTTTRYHERHRMHEDEIYLRAKFPWKTFRTGFHHFHNHLHLTKRGALRRARNSQIRR